MTLQPTLPWSDWLTAPLAVVYKQDHRSKVWRVDPPVEQHACSPCPIVIKRFDHHPLRQRLALWLGLHPAQHEQASTQALINAGLPVIPIMGRRVEPHGILGCRVHLATAWRGVSLQSLKKKNKLPETEEQIDALLAAVGAMAAQMLTLGWVFRDFKTANILVDEQYKPWLIDVGSARQGRPCTSSKAGLRAWRMLRMLDHTMTQDGWAVAARRNALARPLACLCPEPVDHAYDKLARIVLK